MGEIASCLAMTAGADSCPTSDESLQLVRSTKTNWFQVREEQTLNFERKNFEQKNFEQKNFEQTDELTNVYLYFVTLSLSVRSYKLTQCQVFL